MNCVVLMADDNRGDPIYIVQGRTQSADDLALIVEAQILEIQATLDEEDDDD